MYIYEILILLVLIFLSKRYQTIIYAKWGYYRYIGLSLIILVLFITLLMNELYVFIPISLILSCLTIYIDFKDFTRFMKKAKKQ